MQESNLINGIKASTDTGQWKLIVSVSELGMSAVLKNVLTPEDRPIVVFKTQWGNDKSSLLAKIETAVFDNPKMLDDYATQIIVDTTRSLWVPASFVDDEEIDSDLFTCVYKADPEDISADYDNDEICLYTLIPGLNSFLQRTLPGCRISSSISLLKSTFQKWECEKFSSSHSRRSIYVNISGNIMDILLFDSGRFLCGTTRRWHHLSDIAYYVVLTANAYDLPVEAVNLMIIGEKNITSALRQILDDFIENIESYALPPLSKYHGISVAAALQAGEELTLINKSLA